LEEGVHGHGGRRGRILAGEAFGAARGGLDVLAEQRVEVGDLRLHDRLRPQGSQQRAVHRAFQPRVLAGADEPEQPRAGHALETGHLQHAQPDEHRAVGQADLLGEERQLHEAVRQPGAGSRRLVDELVGAPDLAHPGGRQCRGRGRGHRVETHGAVARHTLDLPPAPQVRERLHPRHRERAVRRHHRGRQRPLAVGGPAHAA
jgi:hypothetical protein